jgi:Dolichyl-phosphate-mannose-protein mannosyltransferase
MEYWSHNRQFAIWTACILAVLVRVSACFALRTYQLDATSDNWAFGYEWGRIAKWLVEKSMFSLDGLAPTADTDPIYSFLIAPFFLIFGTFSTNAAIALIVFQTLIAGLTTWAVFVVAEKLCGPLEARISALLFALYPASVFFAVSRIGPSTLAILLLCLIFLTVRRVPSSQGPGISILTGVLIGIVVLTSSDNLSLLLVIPLWLFLVGTGQRGRMILQSSVVVAAAVIVLLPWSLRNSTILGEATISKANLGYHLYVGNNPHATGYFYTSLPPALSGDASPYKESEYYEMAFSWIAQHPGDFLKLTLKRIQYFWYTIEGRSDSRKDVLSGGLLLTMVAFAAIGVFWRNQSAEGASLLWLFAAIYPLVFYFTHASFYRHRYHIEPFVLILASHGMAVLWAYYRAGRLKAIDETPTVFASTKDH